MKASRLLEQQKNHRGAINRAYYAAFSAMTAEIRKRTMDFAHGYEHPRHIELDRYIKKFLIDRSKADRQDLRDEIKRLYRARVEADYRHAAGLDDRDVRDARHDADYVLQSLAVR